MKIKKFLTSSVGCKMIMALTGLIMLGFLFAHLAGNLLVFAGRDALRAYASGLRDILPILNILRFGLIGGIALHIWAAIRLRRISQKASPHAYQVKSVVKASRSSRSMAFTGGTILLFIGYHLAHLTFRWTHPEFQGFDTFDIYPMIIASFQNPFLSLFYLVSISCVMIHLSHGITSFFQTMGYSHPDHQKMINCLGPATSGLLWVGYASIPLSILSGLIS
ncbi:MAG: succinate dehydrogenase cytochrome b subunit [Oligoflexales bacterium]